MRLLYIIPYVPSSIRVRPYELIRALVKQDVDLTVFCPSSSDDEQAITDLRDCGVRVHAVPVGGSDRLWAMARGTAIGMPLQAAYGVPAPLAASLKRVIASETFDLVHIEHVRAAALLPIVRHLPVVYDAVDCISLLFDRTRRRGPDWRSRLIAAVEIGPTRRFERRVLRQATITAVTSAEDAAALRGLAPETDVRIVPNGVDLRRFAPPTRPRQRETIVFTGKMSYHANIAAAQRLVDQIMPRVWQQRPAAQLWIVGSDPPRSITRYAADPRITVTGRVPTIVPYVQQATIAVSPLRYGVGVQNKVLEALATATPTIVDLQCLTALGAKPGRDLGVTTDDDQFARAIVRLLDDQRERDRLGAAGRVYVEQHHDWIKSAATLLQLYQHALQAPHAAAFHAQQPHHALP